MGVVMPGQMLASDSNYEGDPAGTTASMSPAEAVTEITILIRSDTRAEDLFNGSRTRT